MAEKLIISWDDYNSIVEKLAIKIHDNYKPDLLIGIMRGGAPIIDVLSRVFKLKCAYLAVESYSGKGIEDQQGKLTFSREMSSTVQNLGGNLLLCDDLSDTGVTLNRSIEWLKKYPPLKGKIKSIKTAVLWKKAKSTFNPDFCAKLLKRCILNTEKYRNTDAFVLLEWMGEGETLISRMCVQPIICHSNLIFVPNIWGPE